MPTKTRLAIEWRSPYTTSSLRRFLTAVLEELQGTLTLMDQWLICWAFRTRKQRISLEGVKRVWSRRSRKLQRRWPSLRTMTFWPPPKTGSNKRKRLLETPTIWTLRWACRCSTRPRKKILAWWRNFGVWWEGSNCLRFKSLSLNSSSRLPSITRPSADFKPGTRPIILAVTLRIQGLDHLRELLPQCHP